MGQKFDESVGLKREMKVLDSFAMRQGPAPSRLFVWELKMNRRRAQMENVGSVFQGRVPVWTEMPSYNARTKERMRSFKCAAMSRKASSAAVGIAFDSANSIKSLIRILAVSTGPLIWITRM